MSGPNTCRFVGLAGVAFFLTAAFSSLPNFLSRWIGALPRLEPAEAIVVLGGGLRPDGMLSDNSLRRVVHGIALHRKGYASVLVFLGPAGGEQAAEAVVRAELAGELGIPREAILTEAGARTTREEAGRAKILLGQRNISRILLVTDSHHMARARRLFDRAGFEVLSAPVEEISNRTSRPEERLLLMRRVLQELLARLYYWISGYL